LKMMLLVNEIQVMLLSVLVLCGEYDADYIAYQSYG